MWGRTGVGGEYAEDTWLSIRFTMVDMAWLKVILWITMLINRDKHVETYKHVEEMGNHTTPLNMLKYIDIFTYTIL